MKSSISTRQLFILGFGLLLATNIIVLAGVAYNRFGEQDTRITLTERELKTPYRTHKENSGLALRINWRVLSDQLKTQHIHNSRPFPFSGYGSKPEWLDRNKMEQLGFDSDILFRNEDNYKHRKLTVPREVYLVLEYDGEAYQEAVSRAQASVAEEQESLKSKPGDKKIQKRLYNAKRWLEFERIEASRLFAVDAGLDPGQLRRQYSNPSRYIIANGLVTTGYIGSSSKKTDVVGRIRGISIDSIHVPLQFRKLFEGINELPSSRNDDPPRPPRYGVDLAYGSRLEPWIKSVHKIHSTKQEVPKQE